MITPFRDQLLQIHKPTMKDIHDFASLILGAYLLVEVSFYIIFHLYLVPKANELKPPIPYRDYPTNRLPLLLRILNRIEQSSSQPRTALRKFLLQWFQSNEVPPLALSSSGLSRSSSFEDDDTTVSEHELSKTSEWTIEDLGKQQVDQFFSWAFFGKQFEDLNSSELDQMESFYQALFKREGLVFHPTKQPKYTPRRLTLENMNPIHRPLLVYVIMVAIKFFAGLFLRLCGFRRITARNGLTGWYRSASTKAQSFRPLVFFHGIAPAGLSFYIPMVLSIARDGRAVIMFENPNISCSIRYEALNEDETVAGVHEIMDSTIGTKAELALCGHSFGSCQLTWLLHHELVDRIKHIILVDPVTILLSEPDVMNNFLYCNAVSKIRIVASSELFTEYYLRRHFSWYNSELWVENVPPSVKISVGLAERDEIVNALKVMRHLTKHEKVETVYWEGVGHANCVTSPARWNDIRQQLLRGELDYCN